MLGDIYLGTSLLAKRPARTACLESGSLHGALLLPGWAFDPGKSSILHVWAASTIYLSTVLPKFSCANWVLLQDGSHTSSLPFTSCSYLGIDLDALSLLKFSKICFHLDHDAEGHLPHFRTALLRK